MYQQLLGTGKSCEVLRVWGQGGLHLPGTLLQDHEAVPVLQHLHPAALIAMAAVSKWYLHCDALRGPIWNSFFGALNLY